MVAEEVVAKTTSDGLAVHVVWLPMLQNDTKASAVEARSLLPDATHYWSEDQNIGLAFGEAIALPNDRKVAWDIYFIYPRGVAWNDEIPLPSEWCHQLGRDERHLRDGSQLREWLQAELARR